MDVIQLNSLVRQLREIALTASRRQGDEELSVAQLAVIESVARTPGSSIADITRDTGLAQSWISKIVADQCSKGVFVQTKDPKDQRRTLISFSTSAEKLTFMIRGTARIDGAIKQMFPHLSPGEIELILRNLDLIHALLSEANQDS